MEELEERTNITVNMLVRKGNLGAFEAILRTKVSEIYSNNCNIFLAPEIDGSAFRSYRNTRIPSELYLDITTDRAPIRKVWSLFHEAGHLKQPYPGGLTQEEKYLREEDAWQIAEEEIKQIDGLREYLADFKEHGKWALDSYAPIDVVKPALSNEFLEKLKSFIVSGGQVTEQWVMPRLRSADYMAVKHYGGTIFATAVLKNPSEGHRINVFRDAKAIGADHYVKELGYIVTHPKHQKRRFAQKVLKALMPYIEPNNIFSTTRVEHMGRVLGRLGFQRMGNTYNEDLNLYVYDAYTKPPKNTE